MSMDHERARAAWERHGIAEIDMWCRHVAQKVRHIIEVQSGAQRIPMIEQAETVFDICAIVNRLAQIDLRTASHIGGADLTCWLATTSGWPDYVAKAFWYCVRNPTMHLGRSWMFADHDRGFKGIKLFADISTLWASRGPDHTIPPSPFISRDQYDGCGLGWSSERGRPMDGADVPAWSANAVSVNFYMPGVLEVLGILRNSVLEGLRTATNVDLERLAAVNATTGFLYSEVDPPAELVELDISDITR